MLYQPIYDSTPAIGLCYNIPMTDEFNKIVSLAKRRGFIYAGSEIYGGLANTYDYGPMGVELLRNIKNLWWDFFVSKRPDIYGLDSNILMSPKVWEASGHTDSFADATVDCKECRQRKRADHLIEEFFEAKNEEVSVEGRSLDEIEKIITDNKIACPLCKKFNWTKPKKFNLLFETSIGIVTGEKSTAYLRGEIAQGMFVNFKNALDSQHPKLPFGLAQSGAAFRNEVTLGKLTFRTLQFNLSELEYFFNPKEQKWEDLYKYWQKEIWKFTTETLGLSDKNLRWRPHTEDELSHYSSRTEDVEYKFPFGFSEMFALAYRSDFDLKNHMEKSGVDLRYHDPKTNEKFIPYVLEPTFGMDRAVLAVLFENYKEEEVNGKKRSVLKLPKQLAPYKAAVFPLLANKPDLVKKAETVLADLQQKMPVTWDARGNIGKRYFAQDEIGTPACVTIDFQTLEDDAVTVRDRDTMKQERVDIVELTNYLSTS